MTDFDQDLRRTLTTQASRVPHRYDLGQEAIVRAHSIRRRRRVIGGVAFAAVLAVGIPVGIQVGDAVSRSERQIAPATTDPAPQITGPTRIDIDIASLPLGGQPLLPYVDGRTVVVGGARINVEADGDINAAAAFDGGAHVFLSRNGLAELVRVTPDGTEELGAAAGTPLASADLRWNGYAVGEADRFGNIQRGVTLVLFDSQDSSTAEVALPNANWVDIYAIADGTIYFRPHSSDGTELPLQTWAPGDAGPSYEPGTYYASAVTDELLADVTEVTDFGTCSQVVDRNTGGPLWDTCKNLIHGFSPDGSFAWAGPDYADGYSLGDLAILDARTGDVLRRLPSFDNNVDFMDATFEDADHLLIRAEQDGQTALVRCTVSTGECELAVPAVDGTSLDRGGSPYLLTD